jgi:hypothetical protein
LLASHPQTLVQPHSGLSLFGLAGTPAPTVLRLAQFGLPLVIGWLVVRRGRWAAVPLIGYGLRVAIDPGDFAYYAVGVLVAALAWQLLRDDAESSMSSVSWIPWAVIAASVALSLPAGFGRFTHPDLPSTAQIVLRFFVPLLVVGYAVWFSPDRDRRVPYATQLAAGDDPGPGHPIPSQIPAQSDDADVALPHAAFGAHAE